MLVAVHDSGHDRVSVCACADDEEDHQEKGLEIEESGLGEFMLAMMS